MAKKTIKVTQIASPIGKPKDQRATLIGLGLNKLNKVLTTLLATVTAANKSDRIT